MLYGVTVRSEDCGSRFFVVDALSELQFDCIAELAIADADAEVSDLSDIVIGQFDCIAELATVGH
jgi:hypothetical protein